ncbi:MAG: hypothetical protein JWR55_2083, partial [Aeromicrobium sp.]|nr:hypothetical protein [Aeromicrobium sp.]
MIIEQLSSVTEELAALEPWRLTADEVR